MGTGLPRLPDVAAEVASRLEAEATSESHRAKLVRGAALWASLWSIRKAAAAVDVPYETLRDFVQRHREEFNKLRSDTLDVVANYAHRIVEESARVALEGLHSGEVGPRQAAVLFGIGSDKLVSLARLQAGEGEPSGLEALLARLDTGSSLELRVHKAGATDVGERDPEAAAATTPQGTLRGR